MADHESKSTMSIDNIDVRDIVRPSPLTFYRGLTLRNGLESDSTATVFLRRGLSGSVWITLFALLVSCTTGEGSGSLANADQSSEALKPTTVSASNIYIQLTHSGTMPSSSVWSSRINATSPVAVGDDLILIDQAGFLYRRDANGAINTLLRLEDVPGGPSRATERIINAAPNRAGDSLYVIFTSSTTPQGMPVAVSPRGHGSSYQVVYSYDFDGMSLSDPRPIRAFELNSNGHKGGGIVVLEDGSILLAIGDTASPVEDGGEFPQDDTSHLGKIVLIDPQTGDWTIVAKGVRNAQRLEVRQLDEGAHLYFVDIGRDVAEELNRVELSALLDTTTIENFGWGRNVDGRVREGMFYIDIEVNAVSEVPVGEAGFIQPLAQWGRENQTHVAGTGPVSSSVSLRTIDILFGDLISGAVYTVRDTMDGTAIDVLRVNFLDDALKATRLKELSGGRPDPRFFKFPDGSAGVLLENGGDLYRMEEVVSDAGGLR